MRRTSNYAALLNILILLALSLWASDSRAQEQKQKTANPAPTSRSETPDKSTQAKRKQLEKRMKAQIVMVTNSPKQTGAPRQSTVDQSALSQSEAGAPAASLAPDCDPGTLLLQFTIGRAFLEIDDYAHRGTTVYYESRQTAPPTLVFSLVPEGPYTNIINIPVSLDANGYGRSEIFYVMGNQLGDSTFYGYEVASQSSTTTIPYTVLPQCNCPPIPAGP
jgi:hypothetical protein